MKVDRYDDLGNPIVLDRKDLHFNELWANISAMDLPHLNPTQEIDERPKFEQFNFFQKISWAHAELTVALELIDGILDGKRFVVQSSSNHTEQPNPFDSRNLKYLEKAKGLFMMAFDNFQIDYEEPERLKRLMSLRDKGWPLIKTSNGWFSFYDHKILMNLPLDDREILNLEHIKEVDCPILRIDSFSISLKLYNLMKTNDYIYNELLKRLLSSLDMELYKHAVENKLIHKGQTYSVEISNFPDTSSLEDTPEMNIVDLYKSFIINRGQIKME